MTVRPVLRWRVQVAAFGAAVLASLTLQAPPSAAAVIRSEGQPRQSGGGPSLREIRGTATTVRHRSPAIGSRSGSTDEGAGPHRCSVSFYSPGTGALDGFGDATGDGVADLLVSLFPLSFSPEPEPRRLLLLDGATGGEVLWSRSVDDDFACFVGSDLDGDGLMDVIGAEWDLFGGTPPLISARRGSDGALLWSVPGSEPVWIVPDRTGDMGSDVLIITPYGSGPAELHTLRGADGLVTEVGPLPTAGFVSDVVPLEDMDGDGLGDLAVVAGFGTAGTLAYGLTYGGRILWATRIPAPSLAVLPSRDLNGDGLADVLLETPGELDGPGSSGLSRFDYLALDGGDGRILWEVSSVGRENEPTLALSPDLDGDGGADVIIASQSGGQKATLKVAALRGADGGRLWTLSFASNAETLCLRCRRAGENNDSRARVQRRRTLSHRNRRGKRSHAPGRDRG